MKVPFSKTFKKIPEFGVKKTFYSLLAATLSYIFQLFKRFPKGTVIVELDNGNKMLLYPRRRGMGSGIHRDLFLHRSRESYSASYLMVSKILQEGDVVLDIGANIGYYALIEAKIVGEKGCVYAVEPVKQNVMFLKENVKLNGYENVQVFQMALGDYDGKTDIHVAEAFNLSSVIKNPTTNYTETQKVEIMTVDSFLADKRKPKLIRMDVEGYEYEILNGMKKTLKHLSPLFLYIELHNFLLGNKKVEEILDMLESNGFKVKFAACYHPVMEHVTIMKLRRKIGESQFRVYDVSFQQLRNLCKTNNVLHAVFAKETCSNISHFLPSSNYKCSPKKRLTNLSTNFYTGKANRKGK